MDTLAAEGKRVPPLYSYFFSYVDNGSYMDSGSVCGGVPMMKWVHP